MVPVRLPIGPHAFAKPSSMKLTSSSNTKTPAPDPKWLRRCFQPRRNLLRNGGHGEAEVFGDHFVGCARAEVVDANREAFVADETAPWLGAARFDAHGADARREHTRAIGVVLRCEGLETKPRDDAHFVADLFELGARAHRKL